MPIGRQVCGRITKVIDNGGDLRFNATLRRSLVVFGVGQVTKNQLKPQEPITAFVLAVAKQTAFAQVKGSYLKVTVTGAPSTCMVGSLIEVKLTKVSAEAIKGDYLSVSTDGLDAAAEVS